MMVIVVLACFARSWQVLKTMAGAGLNIIRELFALGTLSAGRFVVMVFAAILKSVTLYIRRGLQTFM